MTHDAALPLVALFAFATAGCAYQGTDKADPSCSIQPSRVEQAVYEPPQSIAFVVPDGDAGTRMCVPGSEEGCEERIKTECLQVVTAPVDGRVELEILVDNSSASMDLHVTSVELLEGSDPAFSIGEAPAVIAPQEQEPLVVVFEPSVTSLVRAEVLITSDALNVPDGKATLAIEGTGTE